MDALQEDLYVRTGKNSPSGTEREATARASAIPAPPALSPVEK
jgi:hypothetical protein